MPARWNEEQTYKFVMLYKEHECLWNMHNEIYRSKQARQSALNDICAKMELENFGINEVKQKVKSLRATFQQEQNKVEKSERSDAGTQDVYKPPMKWFPLMNDIMKQGVLKRTSQSSLGTATDKPEGDDDVNESEVGDSAQHPPQSENTEGKSTPAVSMQKTSSRKRITEVTAAIKELKELNKTISGLKQVDAECETFGKYVAIQLQKLHPKHCILAQEEIQRLLTKYRLATLSSNNSGPTTPPTSVSPAHSSYSSSVGAIVSPCSVSPQCNVNPLL